MVQYQYKKYAKYSLLCWALLFSTTSTNAQKYDNNWLFSLARGVDTLSQPVKGNTQLTFAENGPAVRLPTEDYISFSGANVAFSDKHGSLIIATNGMIIKQWTKGLIDDTLSYSPLWEGFNSDNSPVVGQNHTSGFKRRGGMLMLPFPGLDQSFAVFGHNHNPPEGETDITSWSNFYSIIRDTCPTGMCEGVSYVIDVDEQYLYRDGLNNCFMACKHANGRDWWIVNQTFQNKSFLIYLLSPQGVELVHTSATNNEIETRGSAPIFAFSPDGSLFANSETNLTHIDSTTLTIYTFDRCSGELVFADQTSFGDNELLGGSVAFSPNGDYVYAANGPRLWQIDVDDNGVILEENVVAEFDGQVSPLGSDLNIDYIMSAPDGRLYILPAGNVLSLHTVQFPNRQGTACNFRSNTVQLFTNAFNSPNFFPNYRLGPIDGSGCDTLGIDNLPVASFRWEVDSNSLTAIDFTDLSYYAPSSWTWDFGDGTTYEGSAPPQKIYNDADRYKVCLTVENENGTDTRCRWVATRGISSTTSFSSNFKIYPNPAKDILIVEDKTNQDVLYYRLISLDGSMIKQGAIDDGGTVDVSDLMQGMYSIVVYSKERVLTVRKVVIM